MPEFAASTRVHPLAVVIAVLLHVVGIALLLQAGHVAPRPVTVTLSLASVPSLAPKAVGPSAPLQPVAPAPQPPLAPIAPPPSVPQPAPPPILRALPEAPLAPVAPPPATRAQSLPLPPPPAPPPPPQRAAVPVRTPPPPVARAAPRPIVAAKPAHQATSTPSAAAAPPAARTSSAQSAPEAAISSSWGAALSAWLDEHKFYPQLAQQRGEQGTVFLRFIVTRDGRVLAVSVVRSSGSPVLDRAALRLLRGARLPPFPADMPGPEATVSVPIHYLLQ